ncbi:MAG TPA: pyridoxal-phosphate dependent enzyme [Polyangiaceae bacterium]|jgi:D-cysteine desulfhydrase|nr:pyridoxal-phosphate dependent enzyme [Polyangiaceae bacterium]
MFARAKVRALALGDFPTPVERLETLSTSGCDLWVKRDDLTHAVYGGNKVRKLERILARARARGTTRLVTVGAIGSHHVLATTYFGRRAGFDVEAVLVPQPRTEHAALVIRASLALGLRVFPVRSWAIAPFAIVARIAHGAHFIPLGGSNVDGAMAYVDAARELAAQVRSGVLPEPDACVVALGSGGTAAGLAAGLAAAGLRTRVVAVAVSPPVAIVRLLARGLAWASRRRARREAWAAGARARPPADSLPMRMTIDARFLGAGYGHPTAEGEDATRVAAREAGLVLDPTYTAKTFACALALVRSYDAGAAVVAGSSPTRRPCVLYWHTLASAPMEPLLAGTPQEEPLRPGLRALLT